MILMALLAMVCLETKAQKSNTIDGAYIYGVAISPTDSVVYMTEVMKVEGAKIMKSSKFLSGRANYSTQLRQYMDEDGVKNRTCLVSFAAERKKAEKKYLKQKNYFTKKGYLIKYLDQSYFTFKAVDLDE